MDAGSRYGHAIRHILHVLRILALRQYCGYRILGILMYCTYSSMCNTSKNQVLHLYPWIRPHPCTSRPATHTCVYFVCAVMYKNLLPRGRPSSFGEIKQMTKIMENGGVRPDEDSTCTANEMLHKAHNALSRLLCKLSEMLHRRWALMTHTKGWS